MASDQPNRIRYPDWWLDIYGPEDLSDREADLEVAVATNASGPAEPTETEDYFEDILDAEGDDQ